MADSGSQMSRRFNQFNGQGLCALDGNVFYHLQLQRLWRQCHKYFGERAFVRSETVHKDISHVCFQLCQSTRHFLFYHFISCNICFDWD